MPQVEFDETRSAFFRSLAIAMTVLPTLSVVLRFWARAITTARTKLWWDDVLAFGAWACCICCCAFTFAATDLGLGKHIEAITPASNVTAILKLLYVSQIIFDLGIAFSKFSVLCFYLRVFTVRQQRFKWTFWITFALVTAFIVYKFPAQVLLCMPPQKYWKPETPGRCDNYFSNLGLLVTSLLLDVITDLMILVLPMPIITGLQLKKGRKAMLFVAFFCGYVTWISSIGRMGAYISVRNALHNPDFTWDQLPVLPWALVEISVSVLSICIPSWFYLVRRGAEHGLSSLFSTRGAESPSRRILEINSHAIARPVGSTNRSAPFSSLRFEPDCPGASKNSHFMEIHENLEPASKAAQHAHDVDIGDGSASRDVTTNNESPPPSWPEIA